MLTTVGIIFVVCIAAMFLAQLFVRPIRRLEAGAQRISAGDYNINVPVETRDEIGVTEAFNEMSRSLTVKEELLVEQRKENAKLLALLMPEPVVERYQQGEEIVPEEHQNVTVIFTEVIGLDRLQAQLTSQGSLAVVTELELNSTRPGPVSVSNVFARSVTATLGSCGLNTPRLDNVRRTVDFALECQRIIDRFNNETGNHLGLRAGIDTGTVSSGLGGEYSVVYDMWGAAVNVAYQVKSGSPQPGIDVTDRVYQALQATMTFTSAGTMSVDGQDEPILATGGAAMIADVFTSAWFYWAVAIAVGLPIGMVVLTEWQHALRRRESYLVRPVTVLRNYLLPLGALLLLLTEARQVPAGATSVRTVATLSRSSC